ncbi:MAG: TonB-dependent receptor [Azospirillaceae bacterium]|nr:TonB-dependent receptor [Azospirillaceae bacterium]
MMRRLFGPATATVALMLAIPVHAHAVGDADLGDTGTVSGQTGNSNAGQLDEIVVTAEQRAQLAQATPLPVLATTGTALQDGGINNLANLTRTMPALLVAPTVGGTPQIYVRGIGSYITTAYVEQAVAFNLDGVYVSRPAAASGFFYDLQRIELLPGPQGTMYGRNAAAGVLNVLPETPKLGETSGDAMVEIGNYNLRKAAGALNVPLADKAALRVAAQVVDQKGYLSDGYDDDQSQAGRVQVLLEPREDLRIRISGDYAHKGGKGDAQVQYPFVDSDNPWIGPSDPKAIAAYYAALPAVSRLSPLIEAPKDNGFIDDKNWGLKADIAKDFDFGTLTIIPAFRGMDEDYLAYVPSAFRVTSRSRQKSVEARLTSQPGNLTWLVGVNYFAEDVKAQQDYDHWVTESVGNGVLTDEAIAAFGQATYAVTNDFRLTAGGRLVHEEKSQDAQIGTITFSPNKPTLLNDVDRRDWNAATWKVGADYDLAEHSLLYATISTGFKAGGFFATAPGRKDYYDPERLTAYTVGIKNRLFDDAVQLNVEAFDYEYRDQQISHVSPALTGIPQAPYTSLYITENAGRAYMRGVEVEGRWKVTADDLLTTKAQYLFTQYTDFDYQYYSALGTTPPVGCPYTNVSSQVTPKPAGATKIFAVSCAGEPALYAPRWSANIGYQHDFRFNDGTVVTAGGDVYFSSSYATAYDYYPQQMQGGYHMTNLRLTYTPGGERWSITGYVNNVENAAVVTSGYQPAQFFGNGYNSASIRPPRMYGARLQVQY